MGLKLTQLKQKANESLHLNDVADNFSELGISAIQVEHDPSDRRVSITQILG